MSVISPVGHGHSNLHIDGVLMFYSFSVAS